MSSTVVESVLEVFREDWAVVGVRSQFHSMVPEVFSRLFDSLLRATPRESTGMLRPLEEGFLCGMQ